MVRNCPEMLNSLYRQHISNELCLHQVSLKVDQIPTIRWMGQEYEIFSLRCFPLKSYYNLVQFAGGKLIKDMIYSDVSVFM